MPPEVRTFALPSGRSDQGVDCASRTSPIVSFHGFEKQRSAFRALRASDDCRDGRGVAAGEDPGIGAAVTRVSKLSAIDMELPAMAAWTVLDIDESAVATVAVKPDGVGGAPSGGAAPPGCSRKAFKAKDAINAIVEQRPCSVKDRRYLALSIGPECQLAGHPRSIDRSANSINKNDYNQLVRSSFARLEVAR